MQEIYIVAGQFVGQAVISAESEMEARQIWAKWARKLNIISDDVITKFEKGEKIDVWITIFKPQILTKEME